ncbi:hypothetical protein SUGI_0434180 [Cryptomeria japonica]|nr:hypothetical protein SUGI_0434180 [Cryptomeria japonica]
MMLGMVLEGMDGWLPNYYKEESLMGFEMREVDFNMDIVEEKDEPIIAKKDLDDLMTLEEHVNCGLKCVSKLIQLLLRMGGLTCDVSGLVWSLSGVCFWYGFVIIAPFCSMEMDRVVNHMLTYGVLGWRFVTRLILSNPVKDIFESTSNYLETHALRPSRSLASWELGKKNNVSLLNVVNRINGGYVNACFFIHTTFPRSRLILSSGTVNTTNEMVSESYKDESGNVKKSAISGVGEPSKDNRIVFVAGATGKVGSRTVRELLKLGFRVRAGVRSLQKAEPLLESVAQLKLDSQSVNPSVPLRPTEEKKIEIAVCDLEKPNEIRSAIGNARVVVCCIGASEKEVFDVTGPYRIDYQATKNLIDAGNLMDNPDLSLVIHETLITMDTEDQFNKNLES